MKFMELPMLGMDSFPVPPSDVPDYHWDINDEKNIAQCVVDLGDHNLVVSDDWCEGQPKPVVEVQPVEDGDDSAVGRRLGSTMKPRKVGALRLLRRQYKLIVKALPRKMLEDSYVVWTPAQGEPIIYNMQR